MILHEYSLKLSQILVHLLDLLCVLEVVLTEWVEVLMQDEDTDLSRRLLICEPIHLILVHIVLDQWVDWLHVIAPNSPWHVLTLLYQHLVDLTNRFLALDREKVQDLGSVFLVEFLNSQSDLHVRRQVKSIHLHVSSDGSLHCVTHMDTK
jgi:hypothetical protein